MATVGGFENLSSILQLSVEDLKKVYMYIIHVRTRVLSRTFILEGMIYTVVFNHAPTVIG